MKERINSISVISSFPLRLSYDRTILFP